MKHNSETAQIGAAGLTFSVSPAETASGRAQCLIEGFRPLEAELVECRALAAYRVEVHAGPPEGGDLLLAFELDLCPALERTEQGPGHGYAEDTAAGYSLTERESAMQFVTCARIEDAVPAVLAHCRKNAARNFVETVLRARIRREFLQPPASAVLTAEARTE